MSSSHIKRLMMPRSWPLPRKTSIWVQKPNPCGHSLENCMPMTLILRDIMGVAHTKREAKKILYSRRLTDEPITLDELSKKYKISRERVRQIENKAFEKLQKHMLNSAKSKNLLPAN